MEDYFDKLLSIEEYYLAMVFCPDAIYVNTKVFNDWDWTAEIKSALSQLGLDPNKGNTRLGCEVSWSTIAMDRISSLSLRKNTMNVRLFRK